MEIVCGEKSLFALECFISQHSSNDGYIVIHVKNKEFGNHLQRYNVKFFLDRMLDIIDSSNFNLPELFHFDEKQFYEFVDCLYNDFEDVPCQSLLQYSNFSDQFGSDIMFRPGCDNFNQVSIGIISNGVTEKIFASNTQATDFSAFAEVKAGTFRQYVFDLLNKIK